MCMFVEFHWVDLDQPSSRQKKFEDGPDGSMTKWCTILPGTDKAPIPTGNVFDLGGVSC